MIPIYLALEGFKSFEKRCEIDFEYLVRNAIFGVAGRTGSGKSSILDAILFALYGAAKNEAASLINLKSMRAEVEFKFEMDDKTYRVTRSISKTKSDLLKSAWLEELAEGGSIPLAEKNETAVNAALAKIIGLDRADLTQVCFLEQGEYDKFLSLTNAPRIDALVRIFKLDKYGDSLASRVKDNLFAVNGEVRALQARIGEYANATTQRKAELSKEVAILGEQRKALESAFEFSSEKLREARVGFERLMSQKRLAQQIAQCDMILQALQEQAVLLEQEHKQAAKSEAQACQIVAQSGEELLQKKNALEQLLLACNHLKQEREREDANSQIALKTQSLCASLLEELDEDSKKLCQLKKEIEQSNKNNMAAALAQLCNKGEPCPVCGTILNQKPHHSCEELEAKAQQASALESAIEHKRARLQATRSANAQSAALTLEAQRQAQQWENVRQELLKQLELEDENDAQLRLKQLQAKSEQDNEHLSIVRQGLKNAESSMNKNAQKCAAQSAQKQLLEHEIAQLGKVEVIEEEDLERLNKDCANKKNELHSLIESFTTLDGEYRRVCQGLEVKKLYESELKVHLKKQGLLEQLYDMVKGRKFISFIVEEKLQRITHSAGERLLLLTNGQLELIYEQQGFCVKDNFNEGKSRAVSTLSGGERFLASLALALSIGFEISRERKLGFLFLDEGFGTLDGDLIETVITALEALRAQNITVGAISHRKELIARLPARLLLKKTDTGSEAIIQ